MIRIVFQAISSTLYWILHALKRFVQSVFFTVFLLFMPVIALFSGAWAGILQGIWESLPEVYAADLSPALTTRIYDRNWELLDTVADMTSRLNLVRIEDLPEHIPNAFVAIEDERFYSHFGIDPIRIVGVILQNLQKGSLTAGASTITQQLIRNIYLSPEKNFTRKIREMILAMRMEYRFTKREILEMYLNTVFFGQSYFGIESAAYNYFSKTTRDLTIAEVSVLASMMKAPNRYNPLTNPDLSRRRQRIVLSKMLELGMIHRREYEDSIREQIVIRQPVEKRKAIAGKAPYFVEHVKKELVEILGYRKVYEGGLRVLTTLDFQLQSIAREVFLTAPLFQTYPLEQFPDLSGAFVVRDVTTGEVLSMIGGRSFETSQFNRVTQARRQVGSSIKPILYAAALENGVPANLVLNDVPVVYRMEHLNQEWSPQNYGGRYHGPSLLRTALEHSYNVTAVQLIEKTGVGKVVEMARKLGITVPFQNNRTIALGSTEILPMEMVSAFSVFANQGIYVKPVSILRVEDPGGIVLYEARHQEFEAMAEESAYQLYDMLRSVVNRGSGRRAKVAGLDVAGKTGTNQDYIDAWFVGLTPKIAVAVTFGFNDRITLGKKASSSAVAAPVVGDFLKSVKEKIPGYFDGYEVVRPKNIETSPICSDSGMLAGKGCKTRILENFKKGKEPKVLCPIHHPLALLEGS